jgi:hypothetical protein
MVSLSFAGDRLASGPLIFARIVMLEDEVDRVLKSETGISEDAAAGRPSRLLDDLLELLMFTGK